MEESPSFQDPVDCTAEMVTHIMFIIAGSALQPGLAMVLVSWTLAEWAKLLLQGLGTGQVSPVYVELVDQLV